MSNISGSGTGNRQIMRHCLLAMAGCCLVAAGCTTPEIHRRTASGQPYEQFDRHYTPMEKSAGFTQTGVASWYGNKFHGKKTASGEPYNMYAMTAAHKTLPLGTYVRVINLENHRSAVVRINDRGPFVDDRIIDLSYLAATRLGIAQTGTGRVQLIALNKEDDIAPVNDRELIKAALPENARQPGFTLQVGSFTRRENAVNLRAALAKQYDEARLVIYHDGRETFYRVRVGRYDSREKGEAARQEMLTDGFSNVRLLTIK